MTASTDPVERTAQKAWPYVDGSIGRVDRFIHQNMYGVYSKHVYPQLKNLPGVWNSVIEAKNLVDDNQDFVVTADHGNLIGEAGVYGHPKNIDSSGLREVPVYRFSGGVEVK